MTLPSIASYCGPNWPRRARVGAVAAAGFGRGALLALMLLPLGLPAAPERSVTAQTQRDGVALELQVRGRAGADQDGEAGAGEATARLALRTAQGQPLSGLQLRAWMSRSRGTGGLGQEDCGRLTKGLLSGALSRRAEVDLNSFRLAVLNEDDSLAILDPRVSFKASQMEALVQLPGRAADWLADDTEIVLTLPERSEVAIVDRSRGNAVRTLALGPGRPTRIAADPVGRRVWIGLDEAAEVVVWERGRIDTRRRIGTGPGRHQLVFTPDGRYLAVTNSVGGSVSLIDGRSLAKRADVATGPDTLPLAYSEASGRFYAATASGSVAVIDPESAEVSASVALEPGIDALAFAPGGRYGFALQGERRQVTVFDSAGNRPLKRVPLEGQPDQIVFSREFAYIHLAGSEKVALLSLDQLEHGQSVATVFSAGQRPAPADAPGAGPLVQAPDGDALFAANGGDGTIYYYLEGMMAPAGTLATYGRRPRGLRLLDRSLHEIEPGVYAASFQVPVDGDYDVPVLAESPRVNACLRVHLDGPKPAVKTAGLQVTPLFGAAPLTVGEPVPLRFRITEAAGGKPVSDIADCQVLAFAAPGSWQWRGRAEALGGGIYEVRPRFRQPGRYGLTLRIPSRRLDYTDLPRSSVVVEVPVRAAAR
ncbi:MAG: YncE family protein [Methylococcaceae bacterium]|nr:YncE family protein [Methylococcaceae bacterium]